MHIENNHTRNGTAIKDNKNDGVYFHQVLQNLKELKQFFIKEIADKQSVIAHQQSEIAWLTSAMDKKDAIIQKLERQLQKCAQNAEGNRQLINKLLNDIEHYQNQIECYKKNFKSRNLWDALKNKIQTAKQEGS